MIIVVKKNNKKKRKGRVVLLLIIAVGLAFAVYVLFDHFFVKKADVNTSGAVETIDETGEDADSGEQEESVSTGSQFDANSVKDLWYFDRANTERYSTYATRNPEIPFDDIVWMVEANLDLQPYSGAEAAADHDSMTVLANKYFYLPEDYAPSNLVEIDSTMLWREAADSMEEMIIAGASEGHRLWVQSGYRSYMAQTTIYDQYTSNDGQEVADTYSARPGHSEHQTGLAVDFNTITDAFAETPEGQWAAEYSWIFGYITRYTKDNTDITLYRPEPWHFRYIGKEAAARYHEENFLSYEEYWVKYVKYSPPGMESADESEEESDESTED